MREYDKEKIEKMQKIQSQLVQFLSNENRKSIKPDRFKQQRKVPIN